MMADKEFSRLLNAHSKYIGAIRNLEGKLSKKIEFDFSIFWQQADGFVILNYDTKYNASLRECLQIIEETGKLTNDDFMKHSF